MGFRVSGLEAFWDQKLFWALGFLGLDAFSFLIYDRVANRERALKKWSGRKRRMTITGTQSREERQ